MAPNGFITGNNALLVAMHSRPALPSLTGGGLRALPGTESSAGKPTGAGQLPLSLLLSTPSQQPRI